MTALSRIDDDGNRVFPLLEVRHAIPLIVLSAGLEVDKLTEGVQELMLQTSLDAGLDPTAEPAPSPEEIVEAFARHFREHPVSPAILEEIRRAFEAVADAPSKAAQALLGSETKSGVLGGGVRPEGTIPAALGRLQTVTQRNKK